MESLGKWMVDSWYFVIPGFLYLIALCKFFELLFGLELFGRFSYYKKNYGVYFGIFLVVSSFVLGNVAILTSQRLIDKGKNSYGEETNEILKVLNEANINKNIENDDSIVIKYEEIRIGFERIAKERSEFLIDIYQEFVYKNIKSSFTFLV